VTTEPFLVAGAQLVGLGLVLAVGVRTLAPEEPTGAALGLAGGRNVPVEALAAAVVLGLALQLPLVELMNVLTDLVPSLAHDAATDARIREVTRIDGALRAISVPLAVVVVPPLTEELLFRGLMLGRLAPAMPRSAAVVVVAVLFGAFHLDPLALVYATLVGLLLGALTLRGGTILPSIAVHAGFNALPILVPDALVSIPGFNTLEPGHVPVGLVLGSTAIAALAGVLLYRALPPPPLEKD
jgi:membrane protease YdiL (CAAX protease family)